MNQNQMNPMGSGYPMPGQNPVQGQGMNYEIPQESKNFFIGFLACVVLMAIACFLPYVTQKSLNLSMNYISYDGDLKDGVFLIALGVVAVILAFKRKYLVSLILQGVSAGIFIYDWIDLADRMKQANELLSILGDEYKMKYGIGFYLVIVGIAGSIIFISLIWKANKGNNVAVQPTINPMVQNFNQPMQQPAPQVSSNCPYCGTPKNPGSPFCPNCGAKL